MNRRTLAIAYVLVMVALIVGLDVAFLRHHFWLRLTVNVGIVLVFLACYQRFARRLR